jgi:hypothetical protein
MRIFDYLQSLRAFEQLNFPFLQTIEDFDMVTAIGVHQERGETLTLKRLFTFNIGTVATLQRRLARLKRLGVVVHKRSDLDRRNLDLRLSARTTALFERYSKLPIFAARAAQTDSSPE